jgi:hypothetical protein
MNCPEVRYANEHGVVTHVASNPIFAKRNVRRRWKGVYHVFSGLARYSHCGKVRRDSERHVFSTTPPNDAVLCRSCNWNMTYNFVESNREEEMRKVQELRSSGGEQETPMSESAIHSCGQPDRRDLEPRLDR